MSSVDPSAGARPAAVAALVVASLLAGCSLRGGGEPAGGPSSLEERARPPTTIALYRAPASIVGVCRGAQEEAGVALLCPTRLPRVTSDFATARGVPAEPLGASAIRDPATGAVVGLAIGHAGAWDDGAGKRYEGGFELELRARAGRVPSGAEPRRVGGRSGRFVAPGGPDREAARFFWTQGGVRYAATLGDLGPATVALLEGVVGALRPVGRLRAPRRAGGDPRVTTFAVPLRGPVALATAGPAVFVAAQGGGRSLGGAKVTTRPALARVSAKRLRVLGEPTEVASTPGTVDVIQGQGVIWLTHRGQGRSSLRLFDTGSTDPIGALRGPSEPVAVAVGYDSAWVADGGAGADRGARGYVRRTASTDDRFSASILVGRAPAGITAGRAGVWVTNALDDTVTRIDPRTNRAVQTLRVGDRPTGITAREDTVWVANAGDGTVTRIDARSQRVVATVRAGRGARGIALDRTSAPSAWVTNELDDVTRISLKTNRVIETIPVGAGPAGVVYGHKAVWVANNLDHTVTRIDPAP